MHTGRLEAFSDGVIAIIITIMVLELHPPHERTLDGLRPLVPVLLSYMLSFIYVGIYWNNHHHLFQAATRVNGPTLWANLHLLFWMSLIPLVTDWMGEAHFDTWPAAAYGFVLFMAAVSYWLLALVLIRCHGPDSALARAIRSDRKGKLSLVLYLAGIGLAFVSSWLACAVYVAVALIWFLPDRRIERALAREHS